MKEELMIACLARLDISYWELSASQWSAALQDNIFIRADASFHVQVAT